MGISAPGLGEYGYIPERMPIATHVTGISELTKPCLPFNATYSAYHGANSMKRPSILIQYTDQQRWDALHCARNDLIRTPNLDALAQKGVLFRNAFVNCPVCMPSRMSMLSGRYPASLGIACNGIEMPGEIPCLHNVLKPYGYHTANIGKLHFKNHASMFRDHREPHPTYGFDTLIHSDEPGCYDDAYIKWVERQDPAAVALCRCDTPPAWTGDPVKIHPRDLGHPYVFHDPEELTHTAFVAEETCHFLKRHRDEPFLCIAGFYAPHAPLNPPRRFVDMYDPSGMPLPQRNRGENWQNLSDDEWRRVRAFYYALVSHIDDQVGRILRTLDELGRSRDTIVVFTSDHGEHLGDHGLVGKGQAYDSSSRVPLIIAYPDAVPAGRVVDHVVEAVDLAPTLLGFCGVQTPPFMQGKSLIPIMRSETESFRRSAFIELRHPFGHAFKAVRTREYLYLRTNRGEEALYDIASDPHQLNNIAGSAESLDMLQQARDEMLRRWFEVESQYPRKTAHY